MKYSNNFNGWIGKIADDFTYSNLRKLLSGLISYYKNHSSSGQKLVVGYDRNFSSKEFAEYASAYMASQGIRVFLSNKPAPSSVLVIASNSKKSLGTLVFTSDEHDLSYMGIRAYDSNGVFLNETNLCSDYAILETKNIDINLSKYITKRWVELFDPGINYNRYLENFIDFSLMTHQNKIFFNPIYGSSQFYFDSILYERMEFYKNTGLKGYTVNNDRSTTLSELKKDNFSISSQTIEFGELMLEHACDLGVIISPDASKFEFYMKIIKSGEMKLKKISVTELIDILSHYFNANNQQGKVYISESLSIRKNELGKLPFEIVFVKDKEFYSEIKNNEFIMAIDSFKRFYLFNLKVFDALTCSFLLVYLMNSPTLSNFLQFDYQKGGNLE